VSIRLVRNQETAGSNPATPTATCVPLAERQRHRAPNPDRRVRHPQGTLGGSFCWQKSPALNRESAGSIPAPRNGFGFGEDPGQLLLVVTPRSERGGRWFDSSPRNSVTTTEANRPDQGPVLKTGGGPHRLWVRVPRLPPRGPGYANGRAARLKPGRLWVRLPPWVLGPGCKGFRLGRQWADHSRLEREMLRVRLPPEPSITPSWSSPECSPPCHGGDRGFKSRRGRWNGTVRKPAKRPGSNPGVLWVRLPPVLLAAEFLGWCSSRRPVKPLPSSCEAEGGRFDSFTTHQRFLMKVRSSIGRTSAPQADEAGSIPARTTGRLAGWRNW
jgi:hypothetical protein